MSEPVSEPRSVREKILDGSYDATDIYPQQCLKPSVLAKQADKLTDAEIASLPAVRAQWAATKAEYNRRVEEYQKRHSELLETFRRDLFAENGIPADSKFGGEMYALAWSQGHAGGYDEIMTAFVGLLPLWELYRDKK